MCGNTSIVNMIFVRAAAVFLIVTVFIEISAGLVDIEFVDGKPIMWNNSIINFDELRVRRVNRSDHLVTGSFEALVEIGNDFEHEAWVYKKAGNAYKKLPFHTGPRNFCEVLKQEAAQKNVFHESCDIPRNGACPWPKKKYFCKGFRAPADLIPEIFNGEYMLEIRYLRDGELMTGYQYYFYVNRYDDEVKNQSNSKK